MLLKTLIICVNGGESTPYAEVSVVGLNREDEDGMEARMDVIRLKQILGGPLTEQELMCLQIEQNGFGCQACPNEPAPPVNGGSSSS
jgi:hypothetical protein